ncbi:MAG: hypothetical protein ABL903_15855 [Methylococcales bacterium]
MKTIDIYTKNLAELIEQSAKIDILVIKFRQSATTEKLACNQELEVLRAKQQETTKRLHALEGHNSNIWENIGCGG